jgi:tRNA threonylcarbamoyladenosine modification (KEOPS) complex  Pcc1 subunit
MVATKEIQDGEEILMDYRFNPKARAIYPSWYVPHDENDAFHRSKIKMTLNDSE